MHNLLDNNVKTVTTKKLLRTLSHSHDVTVYIGGKRCATPSSSRLQETKSNETTRHTTEKQRNNQAKTGFCCSVSSVRHLLLVVELFPVRQDLLLEEHRRQLPGLLVLRGPHLLQQRGHAGRILRVLL